MWIRASKPFATPPEAAAVLAEVAGGPFHDFQLERDRSFARTTFRFSGTVDFSAGLESFSDPELTAALDGEALGQDIAAIEEQFGGALDRLVQVRVAVRLPGAVSSNAPGKADNGAVWEPRLSERRAGVARGRRAESGTRARWCCWRSRRWRRSPSCCSCW